MRNLIPFMVLCVTGCGSPLGDVQPSGEFSPAFDTSEESLRLDTGLTDAVVPTGGRPTFQRCMEVAQTGTDQDFEGICRDLSPLDRQARRECWQAASGSRLQKEVWCHNFATVQ